MWVLASLRPRHCTLDGGSGTHTVCAGPKTLMLHASGLKETTEEFLAVCQLNNEDCIFSKCASWSTCAKTVLQQSLASIIESVDQQWIIAAHSRPLFSHQRSLLKGSQTSTEEPSFRK